MNFYTQLALLVFLFFSVLETRPEQFTSSFEKYFYNRACYMFFMRYIQNKVMKGVVMISCRVRISQRKLRIIVISPNTTPFTFRRFLL